MVDDLGGMQASTSPEEPHQIHTKSFGTTFLDFPAIPAWGSAGTVGVAFAGAAQEAVGAQLAPLPQAKTLPVDKNDPATVTNENRIDLDMIEPFLCGLQPQLRC
jgi:hypothetical protein